MLRVLSYLVCLNLLFIGSNAWSQVTDSQLLYHQVRVQIPDDGVIQKLQRIGLDLHCGASHEAGHVDVVLSDLEVDMLKDKGITFDITISDLSKATLKRISKDYPSALESLKKEKLLSQQRNVGQQTGCNIDERSVPLNFRLGTMNGFTRYNEMLIELDRMKDKFPDLITIKTPLSDTIRTFENRPIYYVKISDNPNLEEEEPQVLYTGMHHAREPLSMMSQLYFMWYLLENYGTNDAIKNLVDHTEFFFVPVLNPDGVLFNEQTNPNGGGFWRKNRNGGHGVDPNRNYGYNWGQNNSGSSSNPTSETYRGVAPFSEAETRMIRDFIESHEINVVLNNHTYSELLLTPFGTGEKVPEPDASVFYAMSEQMTWENRYRYGNTKDNIYPVNGDADDWAYGEQHTKNKIFAFTPEIGSSSEGGFWPSPSRIVPQCKEVFRTYLMAAYVAGNYAVFHDNTSICVTEKESELTFLLEHISAKKGTFTVSIVPMSDNIKLIENLDLTSDTLANNGYEMLSTNFNLQDNVSEGEKIQFEVTINNGSYDLYTKQITKYYKPKIILEENADEFGMPGWSGTWQVVDQPYKSGYSYILPPDVQSDVDALIIHQPFDLSISKRANAQFYMQHAITRLSGYVTFEASTDNENWTALCGALTKKTFNHRINDLNAQPIYDGRKRAWVREEVDLSAFLGQSEVYLRFRGNVFGLDSERSFYLDDLVVIVDQLPIASVGPVDLIHINMYPNLISMTDNVVVRTKNVDTGLEVNVVQCDGRLVARHILEKGQLIYELSTNGLRPGMYFVNIRAGSREEIFKLIITH